jgi:small subunit ribosomal protein S9
LADNATYYYGTGRRKNAVARVRLYPGEGTIMVNNKPPLQYFGRRMLEMVVVEPLRLTESAKRFNVSAMVDGGSTALRAPLSSPTLRCGRCSRSTACSRATRA